MDGYGSLLPCGGLSSVYHRLNCSAWVSRTSSNSSFNKMSFSVWSQVESEMCVEWHRTVSAHNDQSESSFLCSERFYLVGKYEGALGVVCRVGCDASNQLEHWSNTWKSTQLIWTYLAANTSTSTATSTATTTTTGTTTAKKKKKKRMRRIIFIDRSKWDDECNDLSFNCYHYWYRHHHYYC